MTWHRPNSPAGRITSPFGPRGAIAGAPDASRNHLGVDLRAGTLTVPAAVYAAAAGTVRQIYKTPLGAWVLELDHGDKTWTRYVHMQRAGIFVDVGDRVAGGQHVAAASNSGAPTVHLHFEVLIGGTQVDPVPWLQARGVDLAVTTTTSSAGSTAGLAPGTPIATPAITQPAPPVQEDIMFIISNDVPGHPQRGTAWVAIPQGGAKPRATTLFGGDKFGTAPVVTFVNKASWDNFAKSIAWA